MKYGPTNPELGEVKGGLHGLFQPSRAGQAKPEELTFGQVVCPTVGRPSLVTVQHKYLEAGCENLYMGMYVQ